MKLVTLIPAMMLGVCVSTTAVSKQATPDVEYGAGQISLKTMQYNQKGVMRVTGPNGYYKEYSLSEGESSLPLYELGITDNGLYKYEVAFSKSLGEVEIVNDPRNGRVNVKRQNVETNKIFGHFRVENGDFVKSSAENNEQGVKPLTNQLGDKHEH